MINKDKNIDFNTEIEYEFLMNRFKNALYKSDKAKGTQMETYLKYSVLFNPEDVSYEKEELEEKLHKVEEIVKIIKEQLKEEK